MSFASGSSLGRYTIMEVIGHGGMSTVYKAYHTALDRYVAIKVLPEFFIAQDPVARERFQQEAVAVAKLRHPNVLAVYDYGDEKGVPYIVSEFIEGGTLADRMGGRSRGGEDVSRLLSPVAAALDYAHGQGILHRDVKPANVLIGVDGLPVLGDFGLAKMLDSGQRFTRAGTTLGTPEYMAPEQSLGEEVTAAADIYSLAVIAYEMLVGAAPFTGSTPMALMMAHIQTQPPPPRAKAPDLPASVEDALLRGLAKAPGDRYPSAGALIQALFAASSPATTRTNATAIAVDLRPDPGAAVSDWRAQIVQLREIRRRCLLAFGGEDMGVQGDKMLGIFSGPLPAVRCVCTVREQATKLGIVLSAGVVLGEVMRGTGLVGGDAVEAAWALAEAAPAGDILVSPRVQELVSGFGPEFAATQHVVDRLADGPAFRVAKTG